MIYAIESLIVFVAAIGVHAVWIRLRKGNELHILSFLVTSFIAMAALKFTIFPVTANASSTQTFLFLPLQNSSLLLFFLLIPTYLMFYSCITIESPSRRLLTVLAAANGASYQTLLNQISDDDVIMPRVVDLERFGYLRKDGEVYYLSARGMLTGRFLSIYQQILGRGMGG